MDNENEIPPIRPEERSAIAILAHYLKGIFLGFGFIFLGAWLLFWNEGNHATKTSAFKEAQNAVIHVDDLGVVDGALDGKFIHGTAKVDTDEMLEVPELGISEHAIALRVDVSYYLWVESGTGGKTTKESEGKRRRGKPDDYEYQLMWTSEPVSSRNYVNPAYRNTNWTLVTFESRQMYADNVSFGSYKLPAFLAHIKIIDQPVTVIPPGELLESWNTIIRKNPNVATDKNGDALPNMVHLSPGQIYFGKYPHDPKLGDVRVKIQKIAPGDMSILAKVQGNTFVPYEAENGEEFSMLEPGVASAEYMFKEAHKYQGILTWFLRFLALLFLVLGLRNTLDEFVLPLQKIPLIGALIDMGIWRVSGVAGLGVFLSLFAVACFRNSLLISIPALALGTGLIVLLLIKAGERSASS